MSHESPTNCRVRLYRYVIALLQSEDTKDDTLNMRGGITVSGMRVINDPVTFLMLSKDVAGHVLKFSISVHAREFRIGVIVPQALMMLLPFNSDEFADRLQAYPAYGCSGFPKVMTRSFGKEGGWYDFVYPERYNEIAEKALSNDDAALRVLADSIIHELMLLSHAFELLLAKYLSTSSKVSHVDSSSGDYSLIRFWSEKDRDQIIKEYGIEHYKLAVARVPSQTNKYGEYMIIVPPEGPEMEEAERLWSEIASREYLFDPGKSS